MTTQTTTHVHGKGCGHSAEAVPHGTHCDNHGKVPAG